MLPVLDLDLDLIMFQSNFLPFRVSEIDTVPDSSHLIVVEKN